MTGICLRFIHQNVAAKQSHLQQNTKYCIRCQTTTTMTNSKATINSNEMRTQNARQFGDTLLPTYQLLLDLIIAGLVNKKKQITAQTAAKSY